MKYKCSILLIIFLSGFYSAVKCQEIKNFRAVQEGNQIRILYDLSGRDKSYNIILYYSIDKGKTWLGPVTKILGDAGDHISPGTNKLVIWDALSEQGPFEGMIQFKIEMGKITAEVAENVPDTSQKKEISKKESPVLEEKKADRPKKETRETAAVTKPGGGAKIGKIVFLGSAVTSAAIGIYTYQQGNSLYNQYNSGSEDAANLRKKIESLDKITPIGFGIAGICGAGFVYEIIKSGKIKKKVTLNPFPVIQGGGINLTLNF